MRCSSKHIPLSFLAIALLVGMSPACSPTGALPGGSQTQPTQSPAAQATSPGGQPTSAAAQPTSSPKQPTPTLVPSGKPTATQSALNATPAPTTGLTSYRGHTITYEGDNNDGPVKEEWKTQVILSPLAVHYVLSNKGRQAMEIIVVGDSVWTKISNMPWKETKQADMSTSLSQMDKTNALDLKEEIPLEDGVTWLTGQKKLHIAKGSLTVAGEETVNGVRCKKYTVNSTYSYTATFSAPINATGKAIFQDQGQIWVASQAPWPPFVVRARLTEAATSQTGKNSKTETSYIEQDVTDINTPISIQPPEGATPAVKTTPVAKATAPSAQQPAPTASQGQPTAVPSGKKSASFTITGTDVIYLAGRDDVKIPPPDVEDETFPIGRCSGDLPETFPASIAVSPGAKLTFKATGEMDFWGGTSPMGPDGEAVSAIDALGGLSGYNGPQGALVGVFLDGANPKDKSAPDALDMESLGTEFATLTPALGQVFFIGDGLTGTGSGAAQTFVVPGGATRLFLGIADGSGFGGAPGCYGDNIGAFQVQVNLP